MCAAVLLACGCRLLLPTLLLLLVLLLSPLLPHKGLNPKGPLPHERPHVRL
jgi:hypothetical protein